MKKTSILFPTVAFIFATTIAVSGSLVAGRGMDTLVLVSGFKPTPAPCTFVKSCTTTNTGIICTDGSGNQLFAKSSATVCNVVVYEPLEEE